MKTDNESNQPKRIFLTDYKAPSFSVQSIDLHFNLHETATLVTATQKVTKLEEAPLILNGENLKLKKIKINGQELAASDFSVATD
ncbi:MAG: hypothetical protein ACXVAX_03080, partial [Pseudobdellovibrio sp.]